MIRRIPVTVDAHSHIDVDIPDGLTRAQVTALIDAAIGRWEPDIGADDIEADYDGLDLAYRYADEGVPPPVWHDVGGTRWACDGYHMLREGWPHVAASSETVRWLASDPGVADFLALLVPHGAGSVVVDPRFSPVIDHGASVAILADRHGTGVLAVYDASGAIGALVMPMRQGVTTVRGGPVRVVEVA